MSGIHDRIRQNRRDRVEQERHEALWERLDTLVNDERDRYAFPRDVRAVGRG